MNYLAHAYLSFNDPGILAGNMISDFVKGRKQYDYPAIIQKGIRLHRFIDEFTDSHAATREIKLFFQPWYRMYSGPFTDIVYDYFLANDPNIFGSETALESFAQSTYESLEAQVGALPEAFQKIFPYMKQYNWLANYSKKEGIRKSFAGMVARARFISSADMATQIFEENIPLMEGYYNVFFPELKKAAFAKYNELLTG